MDHVGYIYFPKSTEDAEGKLYDSLKSCGVSISHLGKADPPKRWKGSRRDFVDLVTSGSDMTLWTFGRDSKLKYDFTIELHTDPRWRHHTFSISSPERIDSIVSSVSKAIGAFIGYAGISGRGKDQDWEILHNSPECPTDLKEKIKRHN